jgi:hypothetical protein
LSSLAQRWISYVRHGEILRCAQVDGLKPSIPFSEQYRERK